MRGRVVLRAGLDVCDVSLENGYLALGLVGGTFLREKAVATDGMWLIRLL